jgi:transcriptional regulator
VSTVNDQLFTTHTPLHLIEHEGKEWLYGHIARANEQVGHIVQKARATAIFMQNHAYISSSWYDHVNVPTWNYLAVHMHGTLEALDEAQTVDSLHRLVAQYEDEAQKHFHISQMTEQDLKAHLRGLQGFRMTVDKIDASWKLSQNRDDANHAAIVLKLRERGDELSLAIAAEMEKMRAENAK